MVLAVHVLIIIIIPTLQYQDYNYNYNACNWFWRNQYPWIRTNYLFPHKTYWWYDKTRIPLHIHLLTDQNRWRSLILVILLDSCLSGFLKQINFATLKLKIIKRHVSNEIFLMDTDPHVFAVGVRVQIMRVYVERNESNGIKCGWVNNGHVIGCIDAVGGHVCSSAWPHIWDILLFNEIHNFNYTYWEYI